jgi:hypothetical protein
MTDSEFRQMVRWLLVFSSVALVLGPVVFVTGAMSANAAFIGATLVIIGAIGLYAGMSKL